MPPRDLTLIPTLDLVEAITRRRLLTAFPALGLVAAGVSCGDDDDAEATPTTGPTSSGGGFPRTVSHALGETTIPAPPQRVVAVIDEEPLDVLLAMGLQPVLYGVTEHYGVDQTPWAKDAGLDGLATFDNVEWAPDVERVAAAEPDLVFDSWTEPDVYSQLSGIAPTVVLRADEGFTWEDVQRLAGEALGMEDAAEQAIAATNAVYPQQAARLASYAGRKVTIAYRFQDELLINGGESPIGRIVTKLGLEVVAPDPALITSLSLEQWQQVSGADILLSPLFFEEDLAAQEADPLFRGLPAVQAGRYVVLPVEVSRAGYIETALSVRWLIPRLADAVIEAAEGRGKKLS